MFGSPNPDSEFPTIGGIVHVRVDGYFSSDTKTKIPFVSTTHNYYVEHVVHPHLLDESVSRAYYRKISLNSKDFHAILTSKNVVKKIKCSVV